MKKFMIGLSIMGLCVLSFGAHASAELFPDAKKQACAGADLTDGAAADCVNNDSKVDDIIRTSLNILSMVAGVAAVIMMIIAGVKYITSQGDSQSTESAKNTVLYAAIGLIVVVLAQVVVKFVLDRSRITPEERPKTEQRVVRSVA